MRTPAHPPARTRPIAQMSSYDPHHRTSVRRSCKQPNGWFGSESNDACLNKVCLHTSDKSLQNQPAHTPKTRHSLVPNRPGK